MRAVVRLMMFVAAIIGVAPARAGTTAPAARPVGREFDAEGYHVRVDLARQVIAIDIPEDRGPTGPDGAPRAEAPVAPTLDIAGAGLVSASILAQKAKQF